MKMKAAKNFIGEEEKRERPGRVKKENRSEKSKLL